MKKNFDNEKYFKIQKAKMLEGLDINMRCYMEIGGKCINDLHASRVLSGFDPDIKMKIIDSLNMNYEVIVCLSAISILRKKKRKDNKKNYSDETLSLAKYFKSKGKRVSIAITKYIENPKVDKIINDFKKEMFNVYKFYMDENYPLNVSKVISSDGLGKNDFIQCKENLILIVAPGPNSGKCAVAISQIYNEAKKNKIKSTYRKYETFLIPSLSINNPINLSCSMAMCDVKGNDCVDEEYLKKTGKLHVIDERDKQSFELLKKILPTEELKEKNSMSDYYFNSTLDGIIDLETGNNHAKKEIIRRYKEYVIQFNSNKISQIEFDEACRIYQLIQKDITYSTEEMSIILKNFVDFWGYECQSMVAIEEMGELIQALCKYKREDYDSQYIPNILEEIADVHNMLNQLEMYYGYEDILKIRCSKIERTMRCLEKERSEKNEKK